METLFRRLYQPALLSGGTLTSNPGDSMNIKHIFFVVTCLLVASCSYLSGTQTQLPSISTEELKESLANASVTVIDCNSEEVFNKNHIVSARWMDLDNPQKDILPTDPLSPLVFYCKNEHCTASHEGAHIAQKMGYKNVAIYSPGIDGWMAANGSVESKNEVKTE